MAIKPLEISSQLIRARCNDVSSAPDKYDFPGSIPSWEQYTALMNLFSRLHPDHEYDLLAGAMAVYGWMPTMMDKLNARDELKALALELRQAAPMNVANILHKYRRSGALRSVNNSTVGTSKLLHFFLPDKISIWDGIRKIVWFEERTRS